MLTRVSWFAILVFVISALVAAPARAYDPAGHFYTMLALARTVIPDTRGEEQELVAFCAQLPDMAVDLDATALYKNAVFSKSFFQWARWGMFSTVGSPAIDKMVTVQHLLHALTGGQTQATQEIARLVVNKVRASIEASTPRTKERAASLCALGFAVHFLFDSFAHVKLDDKDAMYDTGMGHAGDWHYPDYPLCAELGAWPRLIQHCNFSEAEGKRFAAWMRLWTNATKDIDAPCTGCVQGARKDFLAAARKLGATAKDSNKWNEESLRTELSKNLNAEAYGKFIEAHPSEKPCEAVLKDGLKNQDLLRRYRPSFTCTDAWNVYFPIIQKAFDDYPDAECVNNFETPVAGSLVSNAALPQVRAAGVLEG